MINKLVQYFYEKPVQISILNNFHKFSNKNYAKLILVTVIFNFVVFRVAYQGKLFEFSMNPIHKPEIKSLEELKAKNFTFYGSQGQLSLQHLRIFQNQIG